MQSVLDGPVLTDGATDARGIGRKTADVVTMLDRGFAPDCPLGFDDDERLEIGPLIGLVQAIQLVEGKSSAAARCGRDPSRWTRRSCRASCQGAALKLAKKSCNESARVG